MQPVTPQPRVGSGLDCFTEATNISHLQQNFCCINSGCITWKSEPTSTWVLAHLASHSRTVVSGKYNLGGDSEEPVVSLGVYVRTGPQTEPQDGISLLLYSSLLQPCSPKCVIPLNIATVAGSPWDQWPPCLPLSLSLSHSEAGTEPGSCPGGLDRITVTKSTAAGTQGVGEKIRDSPRLPGEQKRVRWGEQITRLTRQSLLSFHFHISRTIECVFLKCATKTAVTRGQCGFNGRDAEWKYLKGDFTTLFNSLYPVGISSINTNRTSLSSMSPCLSSFLTTSWRRVVS